MTSVIRTHAGMLSSALAQYGPMVAALVVVAPFVWPATYLGDHLTFWSAGHLAATGGSPYDPEALRRVARSVSQTGVAVDVLDAGEYRIDWTYPPWTAFAFVPFGALPAEIGLPLLHAALLVATIASAVAFARRLPVGRHDAQALALVLVALFQPVLISIRGGQFSGILLGGAFLGLVGLQTGRLGPLLIGALILSLKPQVAVGVGVLTFVVLLRRKRWADLAATSAALVALAWIAATVRPEAPGAMATGMAERLATRGSTLWTALTPVAADPAVVIVLVAAAAAVLCGIAVARTAPTARPYTVYSASFILTLAVLPYEQQYDQVLLVPAILIAVCALEGMTARRRLYLVWVVAAVVVAPWVLYVLSLGTRVPGWSGIVPIMVAIVLSVSTLKPSPPAKASRDA